MKPQEEIPVNAKIRALEAEVDARRADLASAEGRLHSEICGLYGITVGTDVISTRGKWEGHRFVISAIHTHFGGVPWVDGRRITYAGKPSMIAQALFESWRKA